MSQLRLLVLEAVEVAVWLQSVGNGNGTYMDIGTGGGIPGMLFACLDLERPAVLLERRRGRCDFLRREVRGLGLDRVQIVEGDARGEAGRGWLGRVELVSLKAVAPPLEALALARPLLAARGRVVLFQRPEWAPGAESWRSEGVWTPRAEPLLSKGLAAHLLSPVN